MRVASGMIEIKVGKIPWPFPANVYAVTIWPFIFYESHKWDDHCVQIHERYHWMDQLRWLVVPWFVVYLVLRIFYPGNRNHPLEREAYRRQDLCQDETRG